MRRYAVAIAALLLSACGQSDTADAPQAACARSATQEVAWTSPDTPDVITTTSQGPNCGQAIVTFVARNGAGDPLWVFASTYYDLTVGGVAPEGAPPVTGEQMDTFLASWADVTVSRSGALPEWRLDDAAPSGPTFAYSTPFERETYEMLRARDLPMICYAAAVEATHCLVIDPASRAPTMIVAYGP